MAETTHAWTPEEHEKLRATIRAENMLALTACGELEAAANDRIKPWSGRDGANQQPDSTTDELVALELGRSSKTLGAILNLCREGYGEQAAMLNRSLFEGMAVAHWVHVQPAEAEPRLKDALRYDPHLAAVLVQEVGWAEEIDANELRDARLEGDGLAAMQKKFGKFGDRMWTGHRSLPDLLKSIEGQWDDGGKQLWQFFKVVNRDNNQLLHATASGLRSAFSRHVEGGATVWVGPSNVHIGQALFGAYWTYGQTLTLVAERFELKDRGALGPLIREGSFVFRDLSDAEVAGMGRNDQCPCESGKKYKDCHLEQVEAIKRVRP